MRETIQRQPNKIQTIISLKNPFVIIYMSIFKDFIYLFLERRKGREKEREENIDM